MKVVCAAIKIDDGRIFSLNPPKRHHDIIALIRESGYNGPVGGERQGFLLENGMFVSRKGALTAARKSGQVSVDKCVAPGVGLFSEDLW